MTIFGWDASDFDWGRGPMDLAAARADGISFFTHKATESNDTQHGHYGEAMNRARAAGIPFLGPYHVVRTLDVNTQVDYHLAYVNASTPWWKTFPGWFFQADLEKWPYDAVAPAYGVAFAAEIERRTGKSCILYAPQWAYGDSVGGAAPLWASGYGANPAGPWRNAYPGDNAAAWGGYSGRTPVILQFGSQATIGRQPICDINAFRGTAADFAALIRGEAGLGGGRPLTNPNPPPSTDWFDTVDQATLQTMLDKLGNRIITGDPQHDNNLAVLNDKLDNIIGALGLAIRGDLGADGKPVAKAKDTHPYNLKNAFADDQATLAALVRVEAALVALKTELAAVPPAGGVTPEQITAISQAASSAVASAVTGHPITLTGSIA